MIVELMAGGASRLLTIISGQCCAARASAVELTVRCSLASQCTTLVCTCLAFHIVQNRSDHALTTPPACSRDPAVPGRPAQGPRRAASSS